MNQPPIFLEIERQAKVRRIFQSVLEPCGVWDQVKDVALTLRPELIVEPTHSKVLSDAILNQMFPHAPKPVELFHYTSIDSLKAIAKTGLLRLHWVYKRIDQGELEPFAIKHRLKGYLDSSESEPYFKTLSKDLFYISLTCPGGGDEFELWRAFALGGTGVRLRLLVNPSRAELRKIQYEPPAGTLLMELNSTLAAEGEPPFVPWTVSKIGAFYLPSTLHREDEVRLLIKRHPGGRDETEFDGQNRYWPLPIGQRNDFCDIRLLEIQCGPAAQRSDVLSAIAGTLFETTVPVICAPQPQP